MNTNLGVPMPCSLVEINNVSENRTVSIFRVVGYASCRLLVPNVSLGLVGSLVYSCAAHCTCCLLGLLFDPEDDADMFSRNVAELRTYTESHPRRHHSSEHLLFLDVNKNLLKNLHS
jgi:hypothetical protein